MIEYSLPDNENIEFYHTFVPHKLRGRGIAAELTKTALNYAIKNNLKVIASCSYVQGFIERNDEYRKLVTEK